jgi:acetolactate synthase-1/3 small subunit
MRHTISVLVHNHAGVLSRVSNLFSARGYNIDSLVVGVTDDPKVSRMTIVARGDDRVIDQVEKQLNKLVDTIKVFDLTHDDFIARDLALIKVKAEPQTRSQVMEIVQCFDGKIVDVALKSFIVEVTGKESKINGMIDLLRHYGIVEMVRTGEVAISRGKKVHEEEEKHVKVKAGKAGQSNL